MLPATIDSVNRRWFNQVFMKKNVHSAILLTILVIWSGMHSFAANENDEPGTSKKRPTVGLVLSGGGAKGFAYIGLLKAIRQAGLQIDYIGGSSIGSIMGGLYALGYDPDSIAKMIRSQNWDNLLKDVIDRKYIAYEEKQYGENTVVTLPIKGKKIVITSSIYKGQEIDLLLNEYFSPAYRTHDFNKLPIPFLCIGTDLFTGNQVILDKGYLPMAIRASMSIPGYFTPTDYMGYYLVDGGVVNNYPAKEVKEMGAQIILGGDVQSGLADTKEQLSSITAILDQITSFARVEANRVGDSLTNLKVPIKLTYGMMDFTDYDSIMAEGERVAKKFYPRIKALADSLNAIEPVTLQPMTTGPLDSVSVSEVVILDNKKVGKNYFSSFFKLSKSGKIALADIKRDIRLMSGSGYFEMVWYELDYKLGKTTLIVHAKEGGPGYLSAGIHFDSEYEVGVLLSGSFRNLLLRNSKLFANLNIGLEPRLQVAYLLGFGGKAGVGISTDFYSFQFDQFIADVKINKITMTNYKSSLFFNYSLKNTFNLKVGFDYEYFRFMQDNEIDTNLTPFFVFSSYGTFFASINADTRDKAYYSTRGFLSSFRLEYTMPLSNNWEQEIFTNTALVFLRHEQSIPISRRFSLKPGIFAGAILRAEDSPPLQHMFGLGGQTPENYIETYIDFPGARFIQRFGFYSAVVNAKLQYNLYRKLYLTARADLGSIVDYPDQWLMAKNMMFGYGLTAGYDSFIGPVELMISGSNINDGPIFYINIGYRF